MAILVMTTTWTDITKPATSEITIESGMPIGLLLALTYGTSISTPIDIWTDVSKASSTSYTKIAKAT